MRTAGPKMPYQVIAAGRITTRTQANATYNGLHILNIDTAGNLVITFDTYAAAFAVRKGLNLIIKVLPQFFAPAGGAAQMLLANYVATNPDTFTVRITDVNGKQLSNNELALVEFMIEVSQFGPAVL